MTAVGIAAILALAFPAFGQLSLGHTNISVEENRRTSPQPQRQQESRPDPNAQADEVLVSTGEFVFPQTDLRIPSRGFDFVLTRTYRSQAAYHGPFGTNWYLNQRSRVLDRAEEIELQDGAGRFDVWRIDENDTRRYLPPPGRYETIERGTDGTIRMTEPDSTVTRFNPLGLVASITDRNGNVQTFEYGPGDPTMPARLVRVRDTQGRSIEFTYNAGGLIERVRDFSGREIRYAYDAAGDLVAVTTPGGVTIGYGYETDRKDTSLTNLAAAKDGKGQTYLVNGYDASDRVVRQQYGAAGRNFSFAYYPDRTVMTDRNDNVREYVFDGEHRITRETVRMNRNVRAGESDYVTERQYNGDGLVTEVRFPRGNAIRYRYDEANADPRARGDLLEIRRVPAGGGAELARTYTYHPAFHLVASMTDEDGFATTYRYDGSGNLEEIARPEGIVEKFGYNQSGQRTRYEDGAGNVTTYAYGQDGYLSSVTVGAEGGPGLTTAFTYDAVGNRTGVTSPKGQRTTLEVDERNRVRKEIGPAPQGYVREYIYDENDNVVRVEIENRDLDPGSPADASVTTEYRYDVLDAVVEVRREASPGQVLVTQYQYDANGNRVLTILAEGNQVRREYDERDLLYRETRGFGAFEAATYTYHYDGNGNLAQAIDAEAEGGDPDIVRFEYDGHDRPTAIVDAAGNRAEMSLDGRGNLLGRVMRDAAGVRLAEAAFEVDGVGRVSSQTDYLFATGQNALGVPTGRGTAEVTRFAWDKASRLSRAENPNGHATANEYDAAGRRVRTVDAAGNEWVFTYDRNSNLTSVEAREVPSGGGAALSFTTVYEYDDLDRVTRVTDPGGNVERYSYDSRGNLKRTTDGEGKATERAHDGLGRLLEERRTGVAPAIVERYEWDRNSRLASAFDGEGHRTRWQYDALDRPALRTDADNAVFRWTYDRDGNVVRWTDENGTVVINDFDVLNRLVHRQAAPADGWGAGGVPVPGQIVGARVEQYRWDGLSRVVLGEDDDAAVARAYDSLGNVIEERQNGLLVAARHDGTGNRKGWKYPSGRTMEGGYDAAERLQALTQTGGPGPAGTLSTFAYAGPDRVASQTRGNGSVRTYGYDSDRRVTEIGDVTATGQPVASYTYGYNKVDRRTFERDEVRGIAEAFRYDGLYRLLSGREVAASDLAGELATPGSQTATRDEAYQYDLAGNRTGGMLDGVTLPFVPNEVNEYLTSPRGAGVHDENGNLVEDDANRYRYDYRNRLVEVARKSDGTLVGQYRYDPFNRRTERTFAPPGGGLPQTVGYVWDGLRVAEERDPAGSVLAEYVHGPSGLDDRLFMARDVDGDGARERYWYHTNAVGSVAALTDDAGAVVERYRYGPWGEVTVLAPDGVTVRNSSAFGNPLRFQSMYRDDETNFDYAVNRFYSSDEGRFVSRDPIGFADGLNRYAFAGNDPVNFRDPLGLTKDPPSTATPRTEEEITQRLLETDPELIRLQDEIARAKERMRYASTAGEFERYEGRSQRAYQRIMEILSAQFQRERIVVGGYDVPNPQNTSRGIPIEDVTIREVVSAVVAARAARGAIAVGRALAVAGEAGTPVGRIVVNEQVRRRLSERLAEIEGLPDAGALSRSEMARGAIADALLESGYTAQEVTRILRVTIH